MKMKTNTKIHDINVEYLVVHVFIYDIYLLWQYEHKKCYTKRVALFEWDNSITYELLIMQS